MKTLVFILLFLCLISAFSIIIGVEWKKLEREVREKEKKEV